MQASTSEKIVTYSALCISVCALVVSVFEVYNQRLQSKADVWPRIQLALTTNYGYTLSELPGQPLRYDTLPNFSYAFLATNEGVGPALIEDAFLWIDEQPVARWPDFFERLGIDTVNSLSRSRTRDRALAPGKELTFFSVTEPNVVQALRDQQHRISIAMCYASVYGEHWYTRRDLLAASDIEYAECDRCPWPDSLALRAD